MQEPSKSGAVGDALSPDRSPARTPPASVSFDGRTEAAGDATRAASSLAGQAKQKMTGTLDSQKSAAADFVEELAQTVRRSSEQFEGQQDWIASAVRRGAAELNTLASSLRDKDLGELAGEVQSFGRRQPALFMGAALAAGFAVARLGKVVAGDLSRDDLPTVPEVGSGQR